jgi:hypothetical protein
MIHNISKKPAMEPMTIPAMEPPSSVLAWLPLSATTVVVACLPMRTLVMPCDRVLVGLVASNGKARVGAIVEAFEGGVACLS